jgi:hypothetical protein
VSDSNPQGTFVTNRGHSTPGTIRKEIDDVNPPGDWGVNADILDDQEIQTLGGLILDVEMRSSETEAEQTRSLFWMMTMKATTMRVKANKLLRLRIPMMKLSLWKLLRCRIGLNAR